VRFTPHTHNCKRPESHNVVPSVQQESSWNDALVARALALCVECPDASMAISNGVLHVGLEPADVVRDDDPSRALESFARAVDAWRSDAVDGVHAFGWLGYDALRRDEPDIASDDRPRADRVPCTFAAHYRATMRIDLATGRRDVCGTDGAAIDRLRDRWSATTPEFHAAAALMFRGTFVEETHRATVEFVRESIRDGSVYLVNVAHTLHAPTGDRSRIGQRLLHARAPRTAWVGAGGEFVASMSMELGIAWDRTRGILRTRPIKGTRPRGASVDEDRRLADELARDPKERAENIMAVDVHRNDLGRIALPGSVCVDHLCGVEAHAYVHHLVSSIHARARPDVGLVEVLRAVGPMGSVTGAPKRAAMSMIRALERERRGVYTGFVGTAAADGSVDLSVAIRTLVSDDAGVHYGVGGGLVADSVAGREWAELQWKARALSEWTSQPSGTSVPGGTS